MRSRRIAVSALLPLLVLAFLSGLAAQNRGLLVVQGMDGKQLGSFQASYALVVGESRYAAGWPQLAGTKTDAQLVSAALGAAGFEVTLKQDLPFEELKGAYEDFIDAHGLEEGNRLLFYYAGHGHTLKLAGGRDMGYIVPVDAPNPNADPGGFKRRAIPMQQFDTWAKQIESRHALFLFDSCFSGSIFNVTRAVPDHISDKTVKAVRQFITSGSADEQVPDRSVFRDQFLAGIGGEADVNGDGYVTGAELGEFLHEKVVNYSHKTQTPQYGKIQDPALDKGDFVFAVAGAAQTPRPAAASPPAGPTLSVTKSYGSIAISAASAGSLYLDGKAMGELPAGAEASLDGIEVGEHSLELRYASGEKESKSATVQKNQAAAVVFSWKKTAPAQPFAAAAAQAGFVQVPAGSFTMGSPASEGGRFDNEGPQHTVRLSAFSIGKYEVTQGEWQAVMGSNPSRFKGDELPVEYVSWYDILVYCNRRSIKEGLTPGYRISGSTDPSRWGTVPNSWGTVPNSSNSTWNSVSCDFSANGYRLPTEAEWEYAAKGGASAGSLALNAVYAGSAELDSVAWHSGNSGNKTQPVGQKRANALGLYDMAGNVWEWCWDWYKDTYYASSPGTDPRGAENGSYRVLRGGDWSVDGYNLRSALRNSFEPGVRSNSFGFRVVVGR